MTILFLVLLAFLSSCSSTVKFQDDEYQFAEADYISEYIAFEEAHKLASQYRENMINSAKIRYLGKEYRGSEISSYVEFEPPASNYPNLLEGQDDSIVVSSEFGTYKLSFVFNFIEDDIPVGNNLVLYKKTASAEEYLGIYKIKEQDTSFDEEALTFRIKANIAGNIVDLSLSETLLNYGTSKFEVRGQKAFLNGVLGPKTFLDLEEILAEDPELETIVLVDVPGSLNDSFNMNNGKLLRQAGLNTELLATSVVASGGVDLYSAGVKRYYRAGAKLGVHSWCCYTASNGRDYKANRLPRDFPTHKAQLEYFNLSLGPKNGPDFYFYTLEQANFDDIYWMPFSDMQKFALITDVLED